MFFDDKFIESLPEDLPLAVKIIGDRFFDLFNSLQRRNENARELILESRALLSVLSEIGGLEIRVPESESDPAKDAQKMVSCIHNLRDSATRITESNKLQRYRELFAAKFGTVFHYEFSEGDLERIQELINRLRDLIGVSKELQESHKQRLLRKLEKLQSELHKKVSDLDRFWGFFIDASIVAGQIGENAKPIVEVMKEIVSIIWPTQTRGYDLPSNFPFKLLGQSEHGNKSNGH